MYKHFRVQLQYLNTLNSIHKSKIQTSFRENDSMSATDDCLSFIYLHRHSDKFLSDTFRCKPFIIRVTTRTVEIYFNKLQTPIIKVHRVTNETNLFSSLAVITATTCYLLIDAMFTICLIHIFFIKYT